MKKVSVFIPTIGREELILLAIKSVLKQTYKNIELIISDAGSPNPVTTILKKNKIFDERIKIIRNSLKLRIRDNYLIGLNNCKGDYVMCLCDDDYIDEDYIDKCVSSMSKKIDAAIGIQKTIGLKESRIFQNNNKNKYSINNYLFSYLWLIKSTYMKIYTLMPMMYKREKLLKNFSFPNFNNGNFADNYIFIKYNANKVAITNSYYYYRVYPESGGLKVSVNDLILAGEKYFEIIRKIKKDILFILILRLKISYEIMTRNIRYYKIFSLEMIFRILFLKGIK